MDGKNIGHRSKASETSQALLADAGSVLGQFKKRIENFFHVDEPDQLQRKNHEPKELAPNFIRQSKIDAVKTPYGVLSKRNFVETATAYTSPQPPHSEQPFVSHSL